MQLEASVEVLRVVVPLDTPNVLPHVKLRDNPNVSKSVQLAVCMCLFVCICASISTLTLKPVLHYTKQRDAVSSFNSVPKSCTQCSISINVAKHVLMCDIEPV